MKKLLMIFSIVVLFEGCSSFSSLSNPLTGGSDNNRSRNTSQANSNGSRVKTPRPPMETQPESKTDAELIAEAVKWGDCAFLYGYTQEEGADKTLVSQANNTIKQYATLATNTEKYRTGKMDPRVRRVPKELMEQVFVNPESALTGVVSSLVNGVSDQFLKVKILHDWICDNIAYDTDMYFSGRIGSQDYAAILKKKKAVCSGYTNLMNEMCRLAEIESIGINGYSKGFGYDGKIGANTDHAWNAVHIGNKWYLVDVTWDAGPMEIRTFIKRYSTEWLFLDSRPFLYSHLPEEASYQFYAPVLTADDFMREAYIAGSFFQYGFALKTEDPEYNNLVDGGFDFDITLKKTNVSLTSELRTPNNQDINAASWAERKGSVVTFYFDVPTVSQYKGNVFARYNDVEQPMDRVDIGTYENDWLPRAEALFVKDNPRESKITETELEYFKKSFYKVADNGYYYMIEDQFDTPRNDAVLKIQKLLDISVTMLENVLNFNIQAASGYQGFGQGILRYPYTFASYNQASNTQLLLPLKGVLRSGSKEQFTVSSRDYTKIAILINGEFVGELKKNSRTGNFELEFEIPEGISELDIFASKDGRNYTGLIRYNIIP